MRIRVQRSGGFAGIMRSAEVDTSGLPDAHDWQALAEQVVADGEAAPAGPVIPDGFSYLITVDGRSVRCADPRLSRAQRTLITRVLREGA